MKTFWAPLGERDELGTTTYAVFLQNPALTAVDVFACSPGLQQPAPYLHMQKKQTFVNAFRRVRNPAS